MKKTNYESILRRFICIGLVFLTLTLSTTAFAQQNPAQHELRSPPATRIALESAAGLGVWTGAFGLGALVYWATGAGECQDHSEDGCSGSGPTAAGAAALLGMAAFILTPIFVSKIGNRHGTFGYTLISGLVGLAASLALIPLIPYIGETAALFMLPVVNVLGNVITFELTHTPPPTHNGITSTSNFQLNPGINLSFRF